jgi:hypothetical protein
VNRLFHLVRADFLERTRRSSFLIMLAATVGAGYLFVPPVDAIYRVLQVGALRGIYNSPWIGLMFGLIAALLLPLVGFYLIKNTVETDQRTGVGEIIATTPMSKLLYVLGKWISNLTFLCLILIVMTVMAVIMQFIRAEDLAVNLWELATPIWLMGLPVLAIVSAIAVFFECTSFLSGGLGNVVYFFLWIMSLAIFIGGAIDDATELAQPTNDIFGYTRQLADVQQKVLASNSEATLGSGLFIFSPDIEGTFIWEGLHWRIGLIVERAIWAGMAVVLALAAAIPFDRFDSAPEGERRVARPGFLILTFALALTLFIPDLPVFERICWMSLAIIFVVMALVPEPYVKSILRRGRKQQSRDAREDEVQAKVDHGQEAAESSISMASTFDPSLMQPVAPMQIESSDSPHRMKVMPTSLIPIARRSILERFLMIFIAEFRLMLKEQHWIWWMGAVGLNVASLLAPPGSLGRILFPILWGWPLILWSKMGIREERYNTSQMVFSSPSPVWGQLTASWVAGILITILVVSGGWIRLLWLGDATGIILWFGASLSIPALALVCGTWVGHSRFFEIAYLLLWYVGLIEQVPSFDFVGLTPDSFARGLPLINFVIAVLFLGIGFAGRQRQIHR